MRLRIEQELSLLRRYFGEVEHVEKDGEDWFRIPTYSFPPGWRIGNEPIAILPIVFKVTPAHPGSEPYAFLTPSGINFNGSPPGNSGASSGSPFAGSWHQFSWSPDGTWAPTSDILHGSNLLAWARSFSERLKQGA